MRYTIPNNQAQCTLDTDRYPTNNDESSKFIINQIDQLEDDPSTPERSSEPSLEERISERTTNPNVDSVPTKNNNSSDQYLSTLDIGGDLSASKSGDGASECPIDQLGDDLSTPERSSEPSLEERIPESIKNNEVDPSRSDNPISATEQVPRRIKYEFVDHSDGYK